MTFAALVFINAWRQTLGPSKYHVTVHNCVHRRKVLHQCKMLFFVFFFKRDLSFLLQDEHPLPEQYKTVWNGSTFVTSATDNIG